MHLGIIMYSPQSILNKLQIFILSTENCSNRLTRDPRQSQVMQRFACKPRHLGPQTEAHDVHVVDGDGAAVEEVHEPREV